VYRLLDSGATALQIAAHLSTIEAEWMGLPRTRPADLLPVAEELRKLDVRLEVGSGPG
jgi:hypothetical protein